MVEPPLKDEPFRFRTYATGTYCSRRLNPPYTHSKLLACGFQERKTGIELAPSSLVKCLDASSFPMQVPQRYRIFQSCPALAVNQALGWVDAAMSRQQICDHADNHDVRKHRGSE